MNVFVIFFASISVVAQGTTCSKNELPFLGRCFCEPGWNLFPEFFHELNFTVDTSAMASCSAPVLHHGDCDCEPFDIERTFLKDAEWRHPQGLRCQNLCRWNRQIGVAFANMQKWHDGQSETQVPYYDVWLPKLLEVGGRENNHLVGRLDEFGTAFEQFQELEGMDLGSVMEFGCGPYTQTRNIMERATNVSLDKISLLDTLLAYYESIPGCTYHESPFQALGNTYPTTFSNLSIEEWGRRADLERKASDNPESVHKYDTVIFMNVLPYAQNAVEVLTTLHDALKPNGLLIFHDRWYDDPARSSVCSAFDFNQNVLQVAKPLIFHFLSKFTREPYFSLEPTEQQKHSAEWNCHDASIDEEPGLYVAVRKTS